MEWSKHIPLPIQEEIGDAAMNQLFDLPVNLFLEWHEPRYLERRWFIEASKYILHSAPSTVTIGFYCFLEEYRASLYTQKPCFRGEQKFYQHNL
ncbi:MAG: hypothetical protein KME52_11830 [Desmonostoc geniculatum HA4340-LM1]|jgi:hypothetical protein|nr:hypothetical protein [Desmonostoc geniculatum HA4340-LM1]